VFQDPENWRDRAQALMQAARDVSPDEKSGMPSSFSQPHRLLFDKYLAELRVAKQWAERWWQSLIDVEQHRTRDVERARRNVVIRWPVGRVAHQGVIAVVRRFWLECDALNRKAEGGQRVAPEEFVLGRLIRSEPSLAEFLSDLPFWPLGMDEHDHWI
jgi:hypothetical protein